MMNPDFTASATTAGKLISTNTFEIPEFQREYAWEKEDYVDFWSDLKNSVSEPSYFLGLVILTGQGSDRRKVVDGQQRLLSITLLATVLFREAQRIDRSALAARIESDFLKTVNYETEEVTPRFVLADSVDNETFQEILDGHPPAQIRDDEDGDGISARMLDAYEYLSRELRRDLARDPFKRLGLWADFLTNRLQFAVFVHPDEGSAYRVFEVINTRGRQLTTADLLKNYLLSQTPADQRQAQYTRWQRVSRVLSPYGSNTFVQFIRHVVTLSAGYTPPTDLYDFLAQRSPAATAPPSPSALLDELEAQLPLYLQMVDPSAEGPAGPELTRYFVALDELGVIAVRPLLLAMYPIANPEQGTERVLELVVRRVIVATLGTGNVERRLGDAARDIVRDGSWEAALNGLRNLDHDREDFVRALTRRNFPKTSLQFARRSIVQNTKTPEPLGVLHFIRPRQAGVEWDGFDGDELALVGGTVGNTLLLSQEPRPFDTVTWQGVVANMLPLAVEGEWTEQLREEPTWTGQSARRLSAELAESAARIWYPE
jgi:hypothetical protein